MKKIKFMTIFALLNLLTSCVGTVTDKNAVLSNVNNTTKADDVDSYAGLKRATAISNDKIELEFEQTNGDADKQIYEIYVNNTSIPLKVSGSSLPINAFGLHTFTVSGLSAGQTYNFNMRLVIDGSANKPLQLDPTKSISATTFLNETADFNGISSVEPGTGTSGRDTLIIKWIPAKITAVGANVRVTDPVGYKITIATSLTALANINNPNYTGTDLFSIQHPASIPATNPPVYPHAEVQPVGSGQKHSKITQGKTYYVNVRAIHKGYVDYSRLDPFYKAEENNKFLKVTTSTAGGLFNFDPIINVSNPDGSVGLSRLDVNWLPAQGDFDHYKVCYAHASTTQPAPGLDVLRDDDISLIINQTTPITTGPTPSLKACIKLTSSTLNTSLSSLPVPTTYATSLAGLLSAGYPQVYNYYQVRVIACRTSTCGFQDRSMSLMAQKQVKAQVSPFGGILNFNNPISETKLQDIKINFPSPVTTVGYLNKLKLYCYSEDLSQRIEIPLNLSASTGGLGNVDPLKSAIHCNGIKSLLPISSYSTIQFSTLKEIEMKLPIIPEGNKKYCFSLVPSIDVSFPANRQEDLANAVVKCFYPDVITPSIAEFPGRRNECSVDAIVTKKLEVSWPVPTAGLFNKYVVFYKRKTSANDTFDFDLAADKYLAGDTTSNYKWNMSQILKGTNSTKIELIPGESYYIAVLTLLEATVSGPPVINFKKFSQLNVNTSSCAIPLPKAKFNEWVDVFAIGPKENGLVPPRNDLLGFLSATNLGARSYITETLDDDGIPVEIQLAGDEPDTTPPPVTIPPTPPSLSSTRVRTNLGTPGFDGRYGAINIIGSITDPAPSKFHQFSNSGIIKLAWKNVLFYDDSPADKESMLDYIQDSALEPTPNNKATRKFGYRVYRSSDNKLTWVDLTSSGVQDSSNLGPIHPKNILWKPRNNAAVVTDPNDRSISTFIDYSVKHSGTNGEEDRARVYWYKIVPIFNNKELAYQDSTNANHHIIRVTLPPRNMALVHRVIANRTMCLEINKPINKSAGAHYSCDYNGLGSSGLSTPWAVGSTVYDLGGDMLVDRFELSCPFSRGDLNIDPISSTSNFKGTSPNDFEGPKLEFKGKDVNGTRFNGCHNPKSLSQNKFEPNNLPAILQIANYNYNQVIPGDCFGVDAPINAWPRDTVCLDPDKGFTARYSYPGSNGYDFKKDCESIDDVGPNFSDLSNPASKINTQEQIFPVQSEFGAVYYNRSSWAHDGYLSWTPNKYRGGNNNPLINSSQEAINGCQINLAYETSDGTYRPRWISTNSLFGRLRGGNPLTTTGGDGLYNKTIQEIETNSHLYGGSDVKFPSYNNYANVLNPKRIHESSTLARIATSNSAKLPPLTGFSQLDLYKACSTYKVDVGVEDNAGAYTSLLENPLSKRVFRKKESIIAAAWSPLYDEAKVTAIEKGVVVPAVPPTTENLSCNSLGKFSGAVAGESDLIRGENITSLFPQADKSQPLLMTGSSSRDPVALIGETAQNTEKCVSRFGIQDLVGNLQEANIEEIFCDYTKDTLYLGRVTNSVSDSVVYGNGKELFLPVLSLWNSTSTLSGACSVNEAGASLATILFESSGIINSIYDYQGLNSSIIKKTKTFDQEAVLSARDGSGKFLEFGQDKIAPRLSQTNSLSLTNPDNIAYFFNPVIGLPLSCQGGSCDFSNTDNKMISTLPLLTSKTPAYDVVTNPESISLLNFPVNNSTIGNVGISEFGFITSYSSAGDGALPVDYVADIDTTPNPNLKVYGPTTTPGVGPAVELNEGGFTVRRDAILKMYTGGFSGSEGGRYSLSVTGSDDHFEKYAANFFGGRCVIMINTDE